MKIFLCFCLLIICFSCKRSLSPTEVRQGLSRAMLTYLWTDHKNDTSKVKYEILDVTYFETQAFYECEYKVHMHINSSGFDTVGVMTARVKKDFSEVKRKL